MKCQNWQDVQGLKVIDGDTLAYHHQRWRLDGFDAPESEQPYGDVAGEQLLAWLRASSQVRVCMMKEDVYARKMVRLYLDGQDLAEMMIAKGLAVSFDPFYPQFNFRLRKLKFLEAMARSAAVGMWVQDEVIHPRAFRQRLKRKKLSKQSAPQNSDRRGHE